MDLRKAIEKRKSVERYSHKKPNWKKIIRAIEAARHAPTAGGMSNIKFILVSDEGKIKELAEATQQEFVGSAPYVVVAVSDDSKLVRSYGKRGIRYSSQQGGAAIQNFLLALTAQGLVTKWVMYFYDEKVRRIFNIPDELIVEGIFPIGKETKAKIISREGKKKDLNNMLYFDSWKKKKMEPVGRVTV